MMGVRNNSPTGADGSQNDKAEINKDIDTTTQTESRRNLGHIGNHIEKNVLRERRVMGEDHGDTAL
jgi:hypothetical protein